MYFIVKLLSGTGYARHLTLVQQKDEDKVKT